MAGSEPRPFQVGAPPDARARGRGDRREDDDRAFVARRDLRQVRQELAVRASVCVLIFALNEWVHAGAGLEPDPTIRGATLTGVFLNGPFYLAARTQRATRLQAYVRMLADIALLTVGLLGAGGAAAAPYVAVYAIVPLYVGIIGSSTPCLVATMAATASYLTLVALQELGWLATPPSLSSIPWTVIAFNLLILNVVGLLTATVGDVYRHNRLRLVTLYQALERAHDESQRLNAEIQRGAHLQALGEVVAGLAHEMRNALGVAMSNLDLALAKAHGVPSQVLRHLDHARQGCEAALRVLQGTLQTARQASEEKGAVSLPEVARRIADLKGYDLHRDGISIRVDFPPEFPRVIGNPFKLQQVLLNLVTNAQEALREATGPRAIALVGLSEEGSAVLEVRDTGPGIPEEVQPRLFKPFSTTKPSGTGLGLAISAGIVQEFGGVLTADNRPEGGAVFRLRLPIAAYEDVNGQTPPTVGGEGVGT
jgi:signal transduction histidine kinase